MLMLSATPGVQAIDNAPFGTKLVLTGALSTPLWVPKSSVPRSPPLPAATAQPGTMVALTLKDCDVTAPAAGISNSPAISAKKGCIMLSARLRRPVKGAFMAVQI